MARENSKFCKKGGIEPKIHYSRREREKEGERGVHASGGLINHRTADKITFSGNPMLRPPSGGGGGAFLLGVFS